jgi:serine/threonine protein kinase
MEDRYEIRGKIGQGGLGAVYRGFDTRMHREVAIKRISATGGDAEMQEESTRQLIKEAGALASLQHPHIVTVYDVGSDEDGPYVVMELISGKTLDELIERAPLTWPDFRELAMQTQEALIAAQELNLIHSDLKPSNLMLTWLPSGKFQVKIVDFGLATLTQSQATPDGESLDAVFGSVFFMPPEQFERAALDARSDIYSMGCVYYQALTGFYPFDGKTGNEVMASHLHHTVKPLGEVRAEIPQWACDWIMWQLNRYPQDRPASSRDALSVFLKNDRIANPRMSLGFPKPAAGPPRSRLVAPGGGPATRGKPGTPGSAAQSLAKARMVQTSQVSMLTNEGATITQTAPQPLAPPEGFKPSVHTSRQELASTEQTKTHSSAEAGQKAAATQPAHRAHHPAKPPSTLQKAARIAIMVSAAILLIIAGIVVMKWSQIKRDNQTVVDLTALADRPDASTVQVTAATLKLLLESMVKETSDTGLQSLGKALTLAEATDGTDVDAQIVEYATKRPDMSANATDILVGTVLRTRNRPVILPSMLEFATTCKDPVLVVSALQAIRQMSDDSQFEACLKLIETADNNNVRDAAELNLEAILRKSRNVANLTQKLNTAREGNVNPQIQKTLQRLLRVCESIKPAAK